MLEISSFLSSRCFRVRSVSSSSVSNHRTSVYVPGFVRRVTRYLSGKEKLSEGTVQSSVEYLIEVTVKDKRFGILV
ncbi:hypothetical protein ANTPLA_LOCUS8464 [Anthophora plagiata]